LASEAIVERLAGVVVTTMGFKETAPFPAQSDGMIARPWHPDRLDEALLAKVPQFAVTRVEAAIVRVAQVTTGDHSERADGRQRARFRTAQRVFAIAIPHDLALETARQVEPPREHVARIQGSFPAVTIAAITLALRPSRIVE